MTVSRTRKILLTLVGVLAVLIGGVWMLQGLNVIGGSMMSGQTKYFVLGAFVALVGLFLVFLAYRRPSAGPPTV